MIGASRGEILCGRSWIGGLQLGANHMKYIVLFVFFLTAQVATAQDWARAALQKSPRHQEWVTVKNDGRSV